MDYRTVRWDPEELLLHILASENWFVPFSPFEDQQVVDDAVLRDRLRRILADPNLLAWLEEHRRVGVPGSDLLTLAESRWEVPGRSQLLELTASLRGWVDSEVDQPIVADRSACREWMSRLDALAAAMPSVRQYVLERLHQQLGDWIDRDLHAIGRLRRNRAETAYNVLLWFDDEFSRATAEWERMLNQRFLEWDHVCSAPDMINDLEVLARLEQSFRAEREAEAKAARSLLR